jgi:alpha-N-arabinofuranosidase
MNVVNRNMEKAITANIISDTGEFSGTAEINTINSDDGEAPYTVNDKDGYPPATSTLETKGDSFTYSFPAHSFTQIRVAIR